MIRDILVPVIKEKFSEQNFTLLDGAQPFATLDCKCPGLGRLELCDDGDEITVYITQATHGHFSCYDEALSPEKKEREIAEAVVDFLEALFADRVEISRVLNGFSGGWRMLAPDEALPGRSLVWQQFVWSHPLHS